MLICVVCVCVCFLCVLFFFFAQARLLETQISNSAYHGASMDKHHIALELEVRQVDRLHFPRAFFISRLVLTVSVVGIVKASTTSATPTRHANGYAMYLRQGPLYPHEVLALVLSFMLRC